MSTRDYRSESMADMSQDRLPEDVSGPEPLSDDIGPMISAESERLAPAIGLPAELQEIAEHQVPLAREHGFFLAGGCAVNLYCQHRSSLDLDWFTENSFDANKLIKDLRDSDFPPTTIEHQSVGTVRAYYDDRETSFIRWEPGPYEQEELDSAGLSVPVASLERLAAMKAGAIVNRGEAKDFYDVHAITQQEGWDIGRFIDNASEHLGLPADHLVRSLQYYGDADATLANVTELDQVTPWSEVKESISAGVQDYLRG